MRVGRQTRDVKTSKSMLLSSLPATQPLLLSFFLFLLCIIHVFVCVHVEIGGQSLCHCQEHCPLPLKQGLSLAQTSPVRLEWLAIEPRDPPVPSPLALGLQAHITTPGFSQGPGAKVKSSCWFSKYIANEAISPPQPAPSHLCF